MNFSLIPIFTGGVATIAAVVSFVVQKRKYARSVVSELGLESFPGYVMRGIGHRLSRFLRPRFAAKLSLRDYALNRLAASSNVMQVPAAMPVNLRLDEMFIPLTALSSSRERVPAAQVALGQYKRVLLVGDPGSGKSTLVKRIYRDACRDAATSESSGRISVLIELRNLDLGEDATPSVGAGLLADHIKSLITAVNTYAGEELYQSFLHSGRVTVLLDGLDEVNTNDFDMMSSEIIRLCGHLTAKHQDNRIIVTTRRQLYVSLPSDFHSVFDAHLTLEPFTADDIYEFLRRWPYEANPAQQLARIFNNLVSQPNIRSMCQTPLILAMYVATDQLSKGEGLPETRPDFYKSVTDELLVRRRSRQLGLATGLNVLRRSRQRILGRLALEHLLDHDQSRNAIPWELALRIVQEEENLEGPEAGTRLRELSRETGLFTEEKPEETLRFIHLTFCEFLAAETIAQGTDTIWNTVAQGIEHGEVGLSARKFLERFAEVIVFAIALENNDKRRKERIQWVLRLDDVELTLRTVLDSQPYDDVPVMLALDEIASSIARSGGDAGDDDQEEWFVQFRQMAMILRDRELVAETLTGQHSDLLAPFFFEVVGSRSSGYEPLFLAYMRLDPARALELARFAGMDKTAEYRQMLIKALDEPTVLAHALGNFSKSDHRATWGPILTIASLYHPSVTSRLMSTTPSTEHTNAEPPGALRRGRNWRLCWATRGTTLGEVWEAGCTWPGDSPALRILASCPTRRSRLTERLGNVTPGTFLVPIALGLMAMLFTALTSPGLTVQQFLHPVVIVPTVFLLTVYIATTRLPSTTWLLEWQHSWTGPAEETLATLLRTDPEMSPARATKITRNGTWFGISSRSVYPTFHPRLLMRPLPSWFFRSTNSRIELAILTVKILVRFEVDEPTTDQPAPVGIIL